MPFHSLSQAEEPYGVGQASSKLSNKIGDSVRIPDRFHQMLYNSQIGGMQGKRDDTPRWLSKPTITHSNPNARLSKYAPPWEHDPAIVYTASCPTVRGFSRSQQRRQILVNGMLQWLVTVGIVLGLLGSLYSFSRPLALSNEQRHAFNAVITLLSVGLSLAVITSFRTYAKIVKWRFLAACYRDLETFELVMQCHSHWKVAKLLWIGRTQGRLTINRTQIVCASSLVTILGLQGAIGLLGLTYSTGPSEQWVSYRWGTASLPDLQNIYLGDSGITLSSQTGYANWYGTIGQAAWLNSNGFSNGATSVSHVGTQVDGRFSYSFVDVTAHSSQYTVATSQSARFVNVTTTCTELDIFSGGYPKSDNSPFDLIFLDEYGSNRTIRVQGASKLTTTYVGNTSVDVICGPRCANIYVLDAGNVVDTNATTLVNDTSTPHLFSCNSTVSQIGGVDSCSNEDDCTLPDRLAQLWAGSIGFSGEPLENSPLQYRTYPQGSVLSWNGVAGLATSSNKEWQVGQFAAGALLGFDTYGPRFNADGWYPIPAVQLNVKWKYCIPVLCIVPAVQFLILLWVCWFANTVLVKDSGYLAAARLLRPVVDRLGDHGGVLTTEEIARELGDTMITYGVRIPEERTALYAVASEEGQDARYQVDIISNDEGYHQRLGKGQRAKSKFPEGKYD